MTEEYYYAYIDKADLNNEEIQFEFHCIEQPFANQILDYNRELFRNAILEHYGQIIFLNNSAKNLQNIFKIDIDFQDTESNWYRLSTNQNKIGLPAIQLAENNNDGQIEIYVNDISRLDPATETSLNHQTSIEDFEDATKEELLQVLNITPGYNAAFVSAYKVGQGNSNAVCNSRSQPLFYFDLGGGCYRNSSSYPTVLRFCFSQRPPILLSHWDTDHYQSAKMNTTYQAETWVVPRQPLSTNHLRFFLQIKAAGTVYIWPTGLLNLLFNFGEIIKCNHPLPGKKNHSGLALIADLTHLNSGITKVLLPADAAYTYIPSFAAQNFHGLIASHHGAEFDTNNTPVPVPSGQSAIAYSYGNPNCFSHPRTQAVNAHQIVGWNHLNRKNTDNGHIAFTNPVVPSLACIGSCCDLQIAQVFNHHLRPCWCCHQQEDILCIFNSCPGPAKLFPSFVGDNTNKGDKYM